MMRWKIAIVAAALVCASLPARAQLVFPSGGSGGGGGGSGTMGQVTITTGLPAASTGTCNSTTSINCNIAWEFLTSSNSPVSSSSYALTGSTATTPDAFRVIKLASGNTALTIAQAGTTGFANGNVWTINNQSGGAVTFTPTTSTIDGNASVSIPSACTYAFQSDGTNYNSTQICGAGGSGNALFGTTTGNTTNDIVTMSNTTTGIKDSGTALSSLAPLASPTFTGTPAAPTPGTNVNTTQIPTSAWVNSYFAALAAANAFTANQSSTGAWISTATGSATAPNFYTTAGGSETGFYFPANAEIGFTASGSKVFDYGISTVSAFTFATNNMRETQFANEGVTFNVQDTSTATSGATTIFSIGNSASASEVSFILNGGSFSSNPNQFTMASAGPWVLAPAGSLTITGLPTATGSYVCSSAGVISVEATACPASDIGQKNPLGSLNDRKATLRLDMLSAAIYTYKDVKTYGTGERVGLYAQDVEKLDPRCVTYGKGGRIQTYDDRCVIAYLVADRKNLRQLLLDQQREIAEIRFKLNGRATVDHASLH